MYVTATAYVRGHAVSFDEDSRTWLYDDDLSPVDMSGSVIDRPCAKCRVKPTQEGHDPCIANLPDVEYACCGHGVQEGYVKMLDGEVVRFEVDHEEEIRSYVIKR